MTTTTSARETAGTSQLSPMKKILVRKAGPVRLTARCSNYCYGNCCCL